MGFFGRGESEQDPADDSLAWVEGGGIPPHARERLNSLADGPLFTSGLSVPGFALLEKAGPRPLAQVMGAAVVRPGWQYLPALEPGVAVVSLSPYGGRTAQLRTPTQPSPAQVRNYQWHSDLVCELDTLTDAWTLARRLALDRLTEEALAVRADAVVGVELRRASLSRVAGTIEYMVTGTAIRTDGGGSSWPALSDLSVQDYWRLRAAGYEPAGLLATTTVVFASPSRSTRMRRTRNALQNQEIEELSRALHSARDTARAHLEGQVRDAHALGAVGVEFSHSIHREKLAVAASMGAVRRGWQRGLLGLPYRVTGRSDVERHGWVITLHAAGTAIRPEGPPRQVPVTTVVRMGTPRSRGEGGSPAAGGGASAPPGSGAMEQGAHGN